MKNHYPIDPNFFAKKLKIFTFACKNTLFFLDIQVKSLLFIIFVCGICKNHASETETWFEVIYRLMNSME